MFRNARRNRIIAGLATTAAVALVPAAASSAADAPSAKALRTATVQNADSTKHIRSGKATAKQTRKATQMLNRTAKRAGLAPTSKAAGKVYYAGNGYSCFYAPAWRYTICYSYTGIGAGDWAQFDWADSLGRGGTTYVGSLNIFLFTIGG